MPTKNATGFSDAEKAAMKERAKELKAEARMNADREAGERAILDAIAKMTKSDKAIAKRVHAIVTAEAPHLQPKTWYGMPAYARDGKVVCFFKDAGKFGYRYAQLGFEDAAKLDDGSMWPTCYALMELTPAIEKKIAALVKKAAR